MAWLCHATAINAGLHWQAALGACMHLCLRYPDLRALGLAGCTIALLITMP